MAAEPQVFGDEAPMWEHYWKHGSSVRCVPQSDLASRLTSACWQDFARSIPSGGQVLDLGTGLGYVLDEIGRKRDDLDLVGVDAAVSLPKDAGRLRIEAGVRMERLPFGNCQFDAVCSQFGFEYSDTEATAREVMRILRPGGTVQLLVHHADGAVVRQSIRRRSALDWVAGESGIFDEAARLAGERRALCKAASSQCASVADGASRKQLDPVAAEVASAVRQIIFEGERAWDRLVGGMLSNLVRQVRNEVAIIAALQRVALDRAAVEKLRSILSNAGLAVASARLLEVQPGLPFAWLLQASKPASDEARPAHGNPASIKKSRRAG